VVIRRIRVLRVAISDLLAITLFQNV